MPKKKVAAKKDGAAKKKGSFLGGLFGGFSSKQEAAFDDPIEKEMEREMALEEAMPQQQMMQQQIMMPPQGMNAMAMQPESF